MLWINRLQLSATLRRYARAYKMRRDSYKVDPVQDKYAKPRECNICGYSGNFLSIGNPLTRDAQCPNPDCRSQARHRLLHLFLTANEENALADLRILHIAPEPSVSLLAQAGSLYVTTDLAGKKPHCRMDLTRMGARTATFDLVVCNHVLEHIEDDRSALAEIYRVLRPGGYAILTVPIVEGWERTYENRAIQTPQERALHFGQSDHVRCYGRDFDTRVEEAGFAMQQFLAEPAEVVRFGLTPGEKVFIAHK